MEAQKAKFVYCLVFVINITVIYAEAGPSKLLPKGFIQCQISGPDFDGCLKDAVEKAIPQLVKGVPKLNLIKIDPLRIIKLEIVQRNDPVNINLTFSDLDIINIKNVLVNRIHYDPGNYSLFMDLDNPSTLILEGYYQISGKIFIFPIMGKGNCKITLGISKILGNVKLNPVIKNGETYLDIERLVWNFTPRHFSLKLDNLFNGDKGLGDDMNKFINENWREVLAELQPTIEDVFGAVFTKIGQEFLNRVPYKQIIVD